MILEVGCGTDGKYAFKPKTPRPHETVFLDIEGLGNRAEVEYFVRADAQKLPFKDKIFSAIYASHVMEHLPHFELFLQDTKRTLNNGNLYIWVPNFSMRTATEDKTHRHVFTYFSLKETLIQNGFQPSMRINSWILNFKFLPLLLGKILGIIFAEELYAVAKKKIKF
jgi:ubiquinone/menaquinone biosynthesis C-methylase UbiE